MRLFSDYMKEAVDFRLGGSEGKGRKVETFSELEKGDKFYRYSVDFRDAKQKGIVVRGPEERTVSDIFAKGQGYTSIKYSGADAFISISDEDLESYFSMQPDSYMRWGNFYSTYEMSNEEVKEICENILKEKKIRESVDFRLGGKTKKGMDDGASLDSIEKGDKVWMYQYYSSSVIKEYEMEVESIDREEMLIELYSPEKNSRYVGSFYPEKDYDDNTNVVLSYHGPDVILSTKQLSQQDVIRIQNDVRTKRVL